MIKKEKENLTNFNINLLTCESIISFHLSTITCLIQLKDGRLVSGSKDKRIIIYVKNLFIKAFEINEHSNDISSLLQLKNEYLVSSSFDTYIKIFKLYEKTYEIIQSIKAHDNYINKVRELSNGNLISCSLDKTIKIYNEENGFFCERMKFIEEKWIFNILETTPLNIVSANFYIRGNTDIKFYDLEKKIPKHILFGLEIVFVETFQMISKNLLIVGEIGCLTIINVENYQNLRSIKTGDKVLISVCYKFNDTIFFTGDVAGNIQQWKIENNTLIFENKKKKAHSKGITVILKLQNNKLSTSSLDKSIIIW